MTAFFHRVSVIGNHIIKKTLLSDTKEIGYL